MVSLQIIETLLKTKWYLKSQTLLSEIYYFREEWCIF